MARIESMVAGVASRLGITIARTRSLQDRLPAEVTDEDRSIIEKVRPFTMTSSARVWSLVEGTRYVVQAGIPGDLVECGVWRGGSVMAMALKLRALNADRRIWLYDTFEGMTTPTVEDIEAPTGLPAVALLKATEKSDGNNVWAIASREDVAANLRTTGYPSELLRFVEGDVSETLTDQIPETISLLRLDTDWYASTRVELEILYPRLSIGGVCILDDYGHWQGARKAVDDYFADRGFRPYMHPIDFSGRVFIKTA